MSGIQLLLLLLLILILVYTISSLRSKKTDIILLGSTILVAAVFVLFPDWTILAANKLGVGRGVDLVFYISILVFWFIVLNLYVRIRKLENMITILIREKAIQSSHSKS